MSLRVWLPLTKDLRNQGLDDVTVTNNGATFDSAGKLGGCYYFNRSTPNYLKITNPLTTATNGVSMAFWVKLPSNGSVNDQLVHIGNGSGWTNNRFTCFVRAGSSALVFSCGDGTSNTNYNCMSSALTLNEWIHVVCLYDSGKMRVYLNGELDKEYSTTIVPSFTNVSYIGVGAGPNTTEPATAYLNDVRIYDHALSPMEIKQLSQGLILHYPLNRNGFGQENLIRDTQGVFVSGFGSADGSGAEFRSRTLGCSLPIETGKTYTLSFDLKMVLNTPSNSPYFIVYNTNYRGPHGKWIWQNCNSMLAGNYSAGDIIEKKIIIHFTPTSFEAGSYTNDNIEFYSNYGTSNWFEVSNLKLEEGDIATPWAPNSEDTFATTIGLNSNIEYDCSGFCNNGSKMTDTITYTSDTVKYQVSTHFNGTYDGILIENLRLSNIINTAVTYAFWIKPEDESGARSVYFGSYNTGPSWSIEKTAGNAIRSYWNSSPDETCNGATITDGVWQHVCLTKNGTNDIKVYINGVQKWASTATHSNLNFPTTYRIGRDTRSNNGTPYKGLMSDFRIYATALSADDVKSLYQNCATIDPDGTIRGQIR